MVLNLSAFIVQGARTRLNERKVGRGFSYHRSIMEQACLSFESSNPGSS